jgi:hypothetical protein
MIAPEWRMRDETDLAARVRRLYALARTRAVLTDASDWTAWEVEMTQDVEQDAIRYWEGEEQ